MPIFASVACRCPIAASPILDPALLASQPIQSPKLNTDEAAVGHDRKANPHG